MQPGGPAPPNWVIADDFISDGRPILGIRWWGSYFPGFFHGFEDGYVLSFFSDVPAQPGPAGSFSRPGDLLGTYVAPFTAVRAVFTGLVGWDGHFIWEYEVKLADTCLEHAAANVATRTAFLEKSNTVYWLAITAEVGHQIFPVHDTNGVIIDWGQTNSNKRATNHFWGWHTSPVNALDSSVMGHLLMRGQEWIYPAADWAPNPIFHMELDQAFGLLTGPLVAPAPVITSVSPSSGVSGDILTITGRGFGDNPDNLCVGLLADPAVAMRVLSATDTRLTVRVGAVPSNAVPGPISVMLGQGNTALFTPVLPGITVQNNWTWQGRRPGGVSANTFTPIFVPPDPGVRWFFGQYNPGNGQLTIDLAGNWGPDARIWVELHVLSRGVWYDLQTCDIFAGSGTTLDCANKLKDLIVCGVQQGQGAVIPATVTDLGGGVARVTLLGVNDQFITIGSLSVCTSPPRVPVITGVSPLNAASGDVLTITGSGFGNNPDNLCVGLLADPPIAMRVLSATDTRLSVRVGAVPSNAVPGRVSVMVGQGNDALFTPALDGITLQNNWTWQGRELGGVSTATFTPRFVPPLPGTRWFFGQVTNGNLCIYLSGDWGADARVWIEVHLQSGGVWYDDQSCDILNGYGSTLDCARKLKDIVVCGLQQNQGVLIPATVTQLPGGVVKVTLHGPEGRPVTDGLISVCTTTPPLPAVKLAKWTQLPGYLVFTNAGQNPDMHGGDRFSDIDWVTLMNAGTNLIQPNWVIADDFRSDGRPILCVRWWGSYQPRFEPTTTGIHFEDGYVLSFFSDFRPPIGGGSRPNRLLGTYVAPINAVKVLRTPFIGWDSNRIYQYEVALEDTCLDHPDPSVARPGAFLERSNTVYWLAITAEVGHRVVPITNATGQIIDWVQTQTNKRATNHFWGWHTAPTNREDRSVMGHVYMVQTNWVYPVSQWMSNPPVHMELDQAFQLLTAGCETNPPHITNFNFSCQSGNLILSFDEPLDPVSATDLSNYGGPGIVSSAVLLNPSTVSVSLILPPCNTLFGLCITGIKDLCGNVLTPGICIDFYCPCPQVAKTPKWQQPPGFLVFTNAGQNPNMHGGDRPSDVDWVTLMQSGTNLVQPNWVIADDFRSDGRPVLCVRWWGSYLPGVQPGFEDGFLLSFFSDFRTLSGGASRPNQLLGTYVAPQSAVKVTDTGFIGWDSNRIYQYEIALEDTCLDHGVPGLATPGAFLEQSNTVYWLAITAQVGHRVVPITNECGAVIDWVQTFSGRRATNHFWGWHTTPTNREDASVMGHVYMQGTNWLYPTNQWMPNALFHMELDQAFVLLTTNPPANPKKVKWSQPPGFVVFTNSPQMHGGDRPSDVDWVTLMQNPTAFAPPNWVIADDFRSDGRPILAVRWWGSYLPGFTPGFEDGFVLSFFGDYRLATAGFSRPTNLLASYVAPRSAVRVSRTPYIGWDSNCIYQYEVNLRDTCLDHANTNIATARAFLERSNTVYWLAITAEVGHRVIPIRNAAGEIVDWQQQTTGKRATNHYWGWHTSPIQREDISVMGHVLMVNTNWIYPFGQWQTNMTFHMELDQAFELLTCPLPPTLHIERVGPAVEISWDGDGFRLQTVPSLGPPGPPYLWTDVPGISPVALPIGPGNLFIRAICP
jgi:hypothetical protein